MSAETITTIIQPDASIVNPVELMLVPELEANATEPVNSQVGDFAVAVSAEAVFVDRNITPTQEKRADKRRHIKFREAGNAGLLITALLTHAEGYRAMDFVKDSALTDSGLFEEGIDKARGDNVDYYLAINPEDPQDIATMRKINIPEGGTYKDLPAFKVCEDRLSDSGKALLSSLEHDDANIIEIAALAKKTLASPYTIHEMFRNALQESLGKNEIWFFSIVSTTFESLVHSFGAENFTVIGEDVPLDDDRVSEDVCLRPALLKPDTFIDTLLEAYDKSNNDQEKKVIMRSFMFFTEGLPSDRISERAHQTRDMVLTFLRVSKKA